MPVRFLTSGSNAMRNDHEASEKPRPTVPAVENFSPYARNQFFRVSNRKNRSILRLSVVKNSFESEICFLDVKSWRKLEKVDFFGHGRKMEI